jgi:hypothetical protein
VRSLLIDLEDLSTYLLAAHAEYIDKVGYLALCKVQRKVLSSFDDIALKDSFNLLT